MRFVKNLRCINPTYAEIEIKKKQIGFDKKLYDFESLRRLDRMRNWEISQNNL